MMIPELAVGVLLELSKMYCVTADNVSNAPGDAVPIPTLPPLLMAKRVACCPVSIS